MTFNRDLTGCVANATVGRSSGAGSGTIGPMYTDVSGANVNDVSFMVALYC